jgi:hypothetical protein
LPRSATASDRIEYFRQLKKIKHEIIFRRFTQMYQANAKYISLLDTIGSGDA